MARARKGRRRLSALLSGLSGALCAGLMVVVLLTYGPPYNPLWWWVMAVVLAAAFLLPLALVLAIEWVMDGYRDERSG